LPISLSAKPGQPVAFVTQTSSPKHRHPNIVTVYDVLKNPDGVFIISELIEGITLRRWIDQEQPSIEQAATLVIKLCRAMDYAHNNGVIHRDQKPGNIVMDAQSEPHVLDFGLSQSLDHSMDSISNEGSPIGTPAFMAPEQVRGNRKAIDQPSDVYAIGVILFQLLAGRLPHVGQKKELYESILKAAPPNPSKYSPKIPGSLDAICQKALQEKRDNRYQSAAELADDLQRYLDGNVVKAFGKVDTRVVKTIVRRRFLLAAMIAMTVAAAAALFWIFREEMAKNPKLPFVIDCSDPDAKMLFTRIDSKLGFPETDSETLVLPGKVNYLQPGFYHVRVSKDNDMMEVYRTVPSDDSAAFAFLDPFEDQPIFLPHRSSSLENGVLHLSDIDFVANLNLDISATYIAGGLVKIPENHKINELLWRQQIKLNAYLLGTAEVSWAEVIEVWPEVSLPRDQKPTDACRNISWDQAIAFAEAKGMTLPSPWELYFAVTNGGETQIPSGSATQAIRTSGTAINPVKKPEDTTGSVESPAPLVLESWDYSLHNRPITGLFTLVDEWTDTPHRMLLYDVNKPEQPWTNIEMGFPMHLRVRAYSLFAGS